MTEPKPAAALARPPEPKGQTDQDDRYYYASQWELIRWRFGRHKLAVISLCSWSSSTPWRFLPSFSRPTRVDTRFEGYQQGSPSIVHWIKPNGGGFGPYMFATKRKLDQETFKFSLYRRQSKIIPIQFFVKGEPYKFWNLYPHRMFICLGSPPLKKAAAVALRRRQDRRVICFSRTLYGARISLSIGLVGVFISFILGVLLGGISGYFGGVDRRCHPARDRLPPRDPRPAACG